MILKRISKVKTVIYILLTMRHESMGSEKDLIPFVVLAANDDY